MAILTVEAMYDFTGIHELLKNFPDLNGRFLALIGSRARNILRNKYLKGRNGGIDLTAFPTDSIGRHTVSSDVNKKRTEVKIYSYPLNLFERGRTLRDGRKEAGKYIITRRLKQDIMRGMSRYTNTFEDKILKPTLKQAGL